jgi:porphobilinogen synthase
MTLIQRPRRLRRTDVLRSMVEETHLSAAHLIAPLFVKSGPKTREPITAMPGQFRLGLSELLDEIGAHVELGVRSFALFPALDDRLKTPCAKEALNPEGLYPEALRAVRKAYPAVVLMSDVALDPYSSDGHDGLVDPSTGAILNDETLPILSAMAVLHAHSGADMIGPSDMMDGRVGVIRSALDREGFSDCSIMSYTAKYASAFYGPFREALDSAPRSGNKLSYQMNPANALEAVREARLDCAEGADFLMVKPGMAYLDIIYRLSEIADIPIAAYQVSGEYSMICAASEKGWIDRSMAIVESLTAFRRAGASVVLSYFAKELALTLRNG